MTPRSRFALASAVFVAWVVFLGYMAATSAEKPQAVAAEVPAPAPAPAPAR